MKRLEIGGTSVLSVGHGACRVMALHGWFGGGDAWRGLADLIDVDRFTYVFPDYRGYGERRSHEGEFSIGEIARDVLALADALAWERFDLLGHSMGAKAAQKVLVLEPGRIGKLVALTPVPAGAIPFDAATWELFSGAAADLALRERIVAHSTGSRLSGVWVRKIAAASASGSTEAAFAAYLRAWALEDFAREVEGIDTPVKVILGEHDPSLTPELMRATFLRLFPNSSLELLGNAGHYPMDETPVALATSVESFLGS